MAPTLRHRAEFVGVSAAALLAARLPFRSLRFLGTWIGSLVWAVDARGRAVTLANLEAAFGEGMDAARRRRVGRASYGTFARTMSELFWAANFNRRTARRWVSPEGPGLDACSRDGGRPIVFPTMHYSNFEWVGLAGAFIVEPVLIIAQKFRNPLLGPIFDRQRSVSGHIVIPQERAMLRTLKHLKGGGSVGMLADLTLDPAEGGVVIERFGGLQTCVTPLHAAMAARTGALLVPLVIKPRSDGGYVLYYHEPVAIAPDTPPAPVVQQVWDIHESHIRERPECWLWAYKHWRYRPSTGDTARYPFYSNPTRRFDKLLARRS